MHACFLEVMGQLIERKKAQGWIGDRILHVEKVGDGQWIFSMRLSVSLHPEALSCFSGEGLFRFPHSGVSLHYDAEREGVYARLQMEIPWKKYIPFKQGLTYFLDRVSECEDLLSLEMA